MEFFSPGHLVVIAIVALVLFFGWKQLPEMSRSVGRSLRIFRTEIKGMGQDDKERAAADDAPKAIDPPPARAEFVKPAGPAPAAPAAGSRPRPTPRPTATTGDRRPGQ